MIQLFPETLFVESSISIAVAGFLLSLGVLVVSIRRLRTGARPAPDGTLAR